MICCLNGKFLDEKNAKISLLDNGFMCGDAFFDTMRTYNGVILELEKHLERIEKTAKILHMRLPFSMRKLESLIMKTSKLNKLDQARLRVTISRTPTIAITCENFVKDEKIIKNGVSTITVKSQRPWPEIKSTNLMSMVEIHRDLRAKRAFEAILIDDLGDVTEGSFTNIFIVKNEKIFTPKDKILSGITRSRVIELAKKIKLKMHIENFKKSSLFTADEIFLTNSLREIIPVVKVDNRNVGSGKPGPFTQEIIKAYGEFIQKYIESNKKNYN